MPWPDQFFEVLNSLQPDDYFIWWTAPDLADKLRWSTSKTYYWVDKMVKSYWLIWRWHPKRHGWHETRQFALPWKAKGK